MTYNVPIVSFDVAKQLYVKRLPTIEYWMGWTTKFYHPVTRSIIRYGRTGKCDIRFLYKAPPQVLLQQYLLEKGCFVSVLNTNDNRFIGIYKGALGDGSTISIASMEKALDYAFLEVLERL